MTDEQEMKDDYILDICKKDIQSSVKHLIESLENMPQHAMLQPTNHYDHLSILLLVKSLLDVDCREET